MTISVPPLSRIAGRRVLFAMARDRLLPGFIAKVHPKYGTPYITTIITGIVVGLLAAFVPLAELSELVNIGTLFAFVVVSLGVIVLRRTRPDLQRGFRVPLSPFLPALSALVCIYLMLNLPGTTWVRFLVWMLVGFVVYFTYGARHSRLATDPNYSREADAAAAGRRAADRG